MINWVRESIIKRLGDKINVPAHLIASEEVIEILHFVDNDIKFKEFIAKRFLEKK